MSFFVSTSLFDVETTEEEKTEVKKSLHVTET